MAEQQLNFPSEVDINKVDLISYSGRRIDIRAIFTELNIYEDIYSNTLTGNIIINDSLNLISDLPLVGEEIIEIDYATPTLPNRHTLTMYVYKLSDRVVSHRSQTYVLHFTSIETIVDLNRKLSLSFSGKISDIVSDIFTNKDMLSANKKLYVEETANNMRYVSPFWSPMQNINWLASRALNKTHNAPSYLFYETPQSYEFVSVDKLMSIAPKRKYVFGDQSARSSLGKARDYEMDYTYVTDINTNVVFDYIRRLKNGMYSGKMATLDMTSRRIITSTNDYIENFNKTSHLNPYPISSNTLIRKKIANQYFIEKNQYLYDTKQDEYHKDWVMQRDSLLEQINAYKINIQCIGRTDIKVGMVIDFTINGFKQFVAEVDSTVKDEVYSGNYLITAIRHRISANKHQMTMELVKDSFVKKVF